MSSKAINITLDEKLIKEIDKAAKSEYASRSDYIRDSIVRKLRAQALDEWGEPAGMWEPGVDLRDKNGKGMPIDEFLQIVKDTLAEKTKK